jgi:transposase-like protein
MRKQKMSKKRRNHLPEFKAKIALAAIKDDQSLAEIAQRYNLAHNQISTWKKQLLERSIHFPSVVRSLIDTGNIG